MVNWRVRARNKNFWLCLIPAIAVFAQALASCFDIKLELNEQTDKLVAMVDTLFVVLGLCGLVNDPTTAGFVSDSSRAMTYEVPYERDINSDGKIDERDIDELLKRLEKYEARHMREYEDA